MPRINETFTNCAAPGVASSYSVPTAIALFLIAGSVYGFFAWVISQAVGYPCEVAAGIITGLVSGLIIALSNFNSWYYNRRLMCIREEQCVVGTVVGKPVDACDGDRKVDLLLSPSRFLEVESVFAWQAANDLAGGGFPAPPPDPVVYASDRALRLEYVNGIVPESGANLAPGDRLNDAQRKQLYFEIVHNQMFRAPAAGDPDRRFQQHMHIRDEARMGTPAFNNSPDDSSADANPMYRYEREPTCGGAGFIGKFFCDFLLGQPSNDEREPRLSPYLHNEIEGDRLGRGITNLQVTLGSFGVAYIAACLACRAIPVIGQIPLVCEAAALIVSVLIAILAWFLSRLFNDPDDGEAGSVSVDVPDPGEVDNEGPNDDVGDVVLLYGRWIMDTEHCEYFEIHPVKAWYRIAVSDVGDPRRIDDPGEVNADEGERLLKTDEVTEDMLKIMCDRASAAEETDPGPVIKVSTSRMLTMARGFF